MIDVTFMISPLMVFDGYPIFSRVISSALERDKNINVNYSNLFMLTNSGFRKNYPLDDKLKEATENVKLYIKSRPYYVFNDYVINSKEINEKMVESVGNSIVLFSSITLDGMFLVKTLLNANKKVVLGGSFTFIYSFNDIRILLLDLGVSQDKLINNLIIVRGYVGINTNFSQIIENWKDVEFKDNDLSTIYDFEEDCVLKYRNLMSILNKRPPMMQLTFNQFCPYQKCTFCNYKLLPPVKFSGGPIEVGRKVNRLVEIYKPRMIWITDNYFDFSQRNIDILDNINPMDMMIFTGITKLKSKKYLEYINKYINVLYIGVESTIDFTLSKIRKGQTYQDILDAFDNMIKYLNKNTYLVLSIVLDLPSDSKENCELNVVRLRELRDKLIDNGFNVGFDTNFLKVNNRIEIVDGDFIRKSEIPTSGANYALNYIDTYPFLPDYLDINFSRFDANGKMLSSDFELKEADFLINVP